MQRNITSPTSNKVKSYFVRQKSYSNSNHKGRKISFQGPFGKLSFKGSSPNIFHLSQGIEKALSNDTKFDINILHESYLNYPNGVKSKKPYSTFKTYAANSYQGTTRTYNEDRIVIIPNMKKPKSFVGKTWPKVSFFGLYDGHGGERCADFLKDHLHSFIINDSNFPIDVKEAIKNGFERAEKDFLSIAVDPTNKNVLNDDSGSCACVIIIVDNTIYSANVGDSRALISSDHEQNIKELTVAHKPNSPKEYTRIIKSGAKIYCDGDDELLDGPLEISRDDIYYPYKGNQMNSLSCPFLPQIHINRTQSMINVNNKIKSPKGNLVYRIQPSTLAVSRTIGDVSAKLPIFGGIPNAVISTPDIKSFELGNNIDFILIGCDGIFDVLDSYECAKCAWFGIKNSKTNDINNTCLNGVNMVIKTAMNRKSTDNVSCVIIGMENIEKEIHLKGVKEHVMNSFLKKAPTAPRAAKLNLNQKILLKPL